jgi:hypothetical protein
MARRHGSSALTDPIRQAEAVPFFEHVAKELAAVLHAWKGPPVSADDHAGKALDTLKRLGQDYDSKLLHALYAIDVSAVMGQPAPASFFSLRPLPERTKRRRDIALYSHPKFGKALHEWTAHIQTHAAAPPADPAALALFHETRRKFDVLSVILAHVTIHETNVPTLSMPSSVLMQKPNGHRVALELANVLTRGWLGFPWKRLYYSMEDADRMMARLRDVHPALSFLQNTPHHVNFSAVTELGTPLLPLAFLDRRFFASSEQTCVTIVHPDADYAAMDLLVDLFQEPARLAARRQDEALSPLERWRQDPDFVKRILNVVTKAESRVDAHTMREAMYVWSLGGFFVFF